MEDAHSTIDPGRMALLLRVALVLDLETVGVRFDACDPAPGRAGASTPPAPLSYCEAVSLAARGSVVVLDRHVCACETASRILGFEGGFHDDDFVESYVSVGLYRDRYVADRMLAGVPVVAGTGTVTVKPLGEFAPEEPPDVVVLSVTPYAAMRLIQAAGYHGHAPRGVTIGMHGICAECTAAPYVHGGLTVSTLCSGARHAGAWDAEHLGVGIPMAILGEVVDGLLDSAQRYETDARKREIREGCRRGARASESADERIEALAPGTSYFTGE